MKLRIAGACVLSFLATQAVKAADLTVVDSRPETDMEGGALTHSALSCNFGVYRVGDDATDPEKVKVLEADLEQHAVAAIDGKKLEIKRWSIYYNQEARLRKMMGGILGVMLATEEDKKKMGSKCPRRKTKGGWYEGSEVTTTAQPLISEFEGIFDGRPIAVRIIFSPTQQLTGKFEGDPKDTESVLQAVHKTAEALATAIVQ